MVAKVFHGWGVELDDGDSQFLPGIGYSPHLTGKPADFNHVIRTLVFATRSEARAALRTYRKNSLWAFYGPQRIYRSTRIVRLAITVEAC